MKRLKVFSEVDVEQFITRGYVVLREAFPPTVATAVREFFWRRLELNPADPSGWKKPVIHLQEDYKIPPFTQAFTDRLWAGYDDIVGEGRYHRHTALGWWPIAFPGFDALPWQAPKGGWHIDGIQFHHHIDSKDQGLLPIFLFSDIAPGDGGTAIEPGSHLRTARILATTEPDGINVHELTKKVTEVPPASPLEMTGRAGDVVLLHPFMLHARSPNTGRSVRFICNPCVTLKENMNLKRSNGAEYSPVERAIVRALTAEN